MLSWWKLKLYIFLREHVTDMLKIDVQVFVDATICYNEVM